MLKQEKERLHKFTSEIQAFLPFAANRDQLNAISTLAGFLFSGNDRAVFLLKGYAGTGKTNLVSAITRALPSVRWRSVLLAPTGRAAKVFSYFAQRPAFTIHKKIFHTVSDAGGSLRFTLAENLHRNTLFIVDESSMIGSGSDAEGSFGNLLENLFEYVYSGFNCKLVLVGDTAQLPPVGSNLSPALDPDFLRNAFYLNITEIELREVARQRSESGILYNATKLRQALENGETSIPRLECAPDLISLSGADLEEAIHTNISEFGEENVIIITRSNKRAGMYNQSFRNQIRLYEEDLCAGDRIMIVKNNYYWLPENNGEAGFIANGDMAEITRITRREELYGFAFCDCSVRLLDYPALPELQVKLITSCLHSDNPALTREEQKTLYQNVLEDMQDEPSRVLRNAYVRKSPYYNALQVKFSYAITCHKSQGGQWPVVFIDQGYTGPEGPGADHLRWLYTAITRASERVYLLNFKEEMLL